uniref:NADH-ubiquinone oxidoreductase chain 6 n=1 Tax=Corigetus marmoratus TaxID=3035952 RepID=A0A9Y1LKQ6_9CUCU|nr:NADH dehydrogenase subunit 6 [Corigetus marmoratus]WET31980.1 NADH dehydrogenase subunit 6 [Corigetus marmoratus]
MLIYLMTLSSILALTFISLNHPLSLGFTLLLQTTISCMILGNLNLNFWFSYILFLIMIGGMLVLFIYMTSIASDEKFNFSKMLSFMFLLFIIFCMIMLPKDNFFSYLELFNSNLVKFNSMEINLSMNKFTNHPYWMMFFTLICYLLITLIATVKIAHSKTGTLRPQSS